MLSGPGTDPGLDNDIMLVHEGDFDPRFKKRKRSKIVELVIAPALVRRGEVFGEVVGEDVIIKMLVSCQKS